MSVCQLSPASPEEVRIYLESPTPRLTVRPPTYMSHRQLGATPPGFARNLIENLLIIILGLVSISCFSGMHLPIKSTLMASTWGREQVHPKMVLSLADQILQYLACPTKLVVLISLLCPSPKAKHALFYQIIISFI